MFSRQAKLEKELFSACEDGNVDRVRRAIAAGVDPKKAINRHSFSEEETPLYTACEYVIIRRGGYRPPPPPSPHPHRSTLLSAVKNYLITIYIIYVKTFRSSRSLSLSQAPPHVQGVVTHTCIPAVLTPTTGIKI